MNRNKKRFISSFLFLLCLLLMLPINFYGKEDKIMAYQQETIQKFEEEPFIVVQNNTLRDFTGIRAEYVVKDEVFVLTTAYSSSVWETDDTPFITASGSYVHWGTVAANFLPFGTKIRIPSIYGDEVFEIKDRMHPRKKNQIDIWYPSRQEALDFGTKRNHIEILEEI